MQQKSESFEENYFEATLDLPSTSEKISKNVEERSDTKTLLLELKITWQHLERNYQVILSKMT